MKIDWNKAKSEYASNPKLTHRDLAIKYSVSERQVDEHAIKENWTELRGKTSEKVQEKLPEKLGEKIAEIKARHAGIGKMLQVIVVESISENRGKFKPKNLFEAKEAIATGVRIEREATDLEKDKPIAIQINFGSKEVEEWAT